MRSIMNMNIWFDLILSSLHDRMYHEYHKLILDYTIPSKLNN